MYRLLLVFSLPDNNFFHIFLKLHLNNYYNFYISYLKQRTHVATLLQSRSNFAAKTRRTKSPGVNTTAKFAAKNIHEQNHCKIEATLQQNE